MIERLLASLRGRLWLVAAVAIGLTLPLAGYSLLHLFMQYATQQFDARLLDQMNAVSAALEIDAQGRPSLARTLTDPRWYRPYSGLYWQIEPTGGSGHEPLLRSRSLWDERLVLPDDALPDGAVHKHHIPGPNGQRLRVMERAIRWGDEETRWRVAVAADLVELQRAFDSFRATLTLALGIVGAVMLAAVAFQLWLGLMPLRALQKALQHIHRGEQTRLLGRFPSEVRPLVDDFNRVLGQYEQYVESSRRTAGNLAHAIKTPLAVIAALSEDLRAEHPALAQAILDEVRQAQRHVDWHLRRARVAGASLAGYKTPLRPVVEALQRVMHKVYARSADQAQPLQLTLQIADDVSFAGEMQDLQEMIGNLLDNACKWARSRVHVEAVREGKRLRLWIDDDGPGLTPEQREQVLARGVRADERMPGSGLGLNIVHELVQSYGGALSLARSPLGGLRAELQLPAP